MKNNSISTLIVTSLAISTIAICPQTTSAQTVTQNDTSGIRVYCGKAADPSSKSNLPATLVSIAGKDEPTVLVIWKSEAFKKYTPQQRCETVSPKFQAAFQAGRFNITSGQDTATGQGIICAVADEKATCDRSTMLFTLKSYSSASLTVEAIAGSLQGSASNGGYQSSGGKMVVDVRALLRRK
ncbi:COP23 domain-containing protein [Chamaesiphon sp. GL140_3_metabinner_50]|uniref:COP23 domain-containing protein n=1 Tax=Chamaesiphon sp. GL140_3_metabinner_50 TaxID=2970812 RepID=UPI0025E7EC40|nr:COP23 domain-containing protein [Chamaesiphon sp. GL140_3_metabinner_50]